MILYTFYNFYMDFRGVINGGTFLEGNQNMVDTAPEKCVSGNYSKENPCKEWMSQWGWCGNTDAHKNGGTDCTQWWNATPSATADDTAGNNDATGTVATDTTGRCGPKFNEQKCQPGEYCNERNGWCGTTDAHKNAQASTKYDGESLEGRCGPKFNEQKCQPGEYCNERNGWCGTTDAHKNAQASTKYDGPIEEQGLTQEQIDIAVAEAMGDSEVKSLTQKIFDKFKVSYNNSLSKQQLKDMLRQIDNQNLPPEGIEFAATFILGLIDFNKNEKLDFNEMLLILLDMKKTQNSEFKRIQNIFSPSYSNNNNNNNYQTLANGNIVIPATGNCPNGCKMPAYDHKDCENTLYNGKSYRQCPWVSVESSHDCGQCGAVLLPKNEHGYAKTQIGYSDVRSLEIISKRIERQRMEQRMETKKQLSRSEFFNIGKEFLKQHGELKGYDVPNNITTKEYTLLGKVLFIYLANKTPKNRSTLKNYIDSLYLEHYLNNKCDNCENNAESSIDKDTKFTLDELKKRDAYAYTEGIVETESDNRLGGSRTQYENRTAYRNNYKPLDPRKFPNPYNSMWDVFP